ncbi:MAG: polyketide synthase, partial [Myxococcales bacterium]|nr:polyketide synthase [Myxococcales bacterium]
MSHPDGLLEEYRSRLRKAMTRLGELESALAAAARVRDEPIAIVGIGCRFPLGVRTPEAFFELLLAGTDAITEAPPDRAALQYARDPELHAPRWGGFVRDVDRFDAAFFGVSPREAAALDPQQRLLLEVTWEALERAGVVPEHVGARVGTFIGVTTHDYLELSLAAGPAARDIYTMTGNGHCFVAGRLAYALGLAGPALTVDTACSSSLVAVHLACHSLRLGECDVALAGGVNLVLSHTVSSLLADSQALAPDGRCKAFDAAADGFVRGEGCGVIVLKRLADALRDRDDITAVIRGSAVNQDGRSTGLTAPNVRAQEALLRQALASARLPAAAVGYIETHGTGTALGDPIEFDALQSVLGAPRPGGAPCILGAVKTNVGHLEAAAGITGLIKAALSLRRGVIPGNLHFKALKPRITLPDPPVVLTTPPPTRPPRATPRHH